MVLAMVFVVAATLAAVTLAAMAARNTTQVVHNRVQGQLVSSARAGIAAGKMAVWERFADGGVAGNKAAYRVWLDANFTDDIDGQELLYLNSAGGWQAEPTAALTLTGSTDIKARGQIQVEVQASRVDDEISTFVYLVSTATEVGSSETHVSETVLRMGGAPWKGFEFVLLANNVNCVFCHADVDNVTRYYPGMGKDTHNRVKAATLEALQMRVGKANSRIAGTLYASGVIQDAHGRELTSMPGGTANIQSIPMDVETGRIANDGWSRMENLSDAMPGQTPFGNFYKGYDAESTFDGEIPESFPPVVPYGDDRIISNDEWREKVDSLQRGQLSGGTISTFADTEGSYTPGGGDMLPRSGGVETYDSNQDEGTREHVVLVGTKDDPVKILDDVAINGDVVISGYVEGDGLLLARGNIYVVGDVIYNDGDTHGDGTGERTFGRNGETKNAWAFAAGGNIIHGNYNQDMTDKLVSGNRDESNGTSGGFTTVEAGLFNRMEWAKTMPYLAPNPNGAGSGDDTKVGGESLPTLTNDADQALRYTVEDRAAGRLPEGAAVGDPVQNNAYLDGYVPRYYSMQAVEDGGKVWLFNGAPASSNGNDGAWWDRPGTRATTGSSKRTCSACSWPRTTPAGPPTASRARTTRSTACSTRTTRSS
jgi:hypothetical protein